MERTSRKRIDGAGVAQLDVACDSSCALGVSAGSNDLSAWHVQIYAIVEGLRLLVGEFDYERLSADYPAGRFVCAAWVPGATSYTANLRQKVTNPNLATGLDVVMTTGQPLANAGVFLITDP